MQTKIGKSALKGRERTKHPHPPPNRQINHSLDHSAISRYGQKTLAQKSLLILQVKLVQKQKSITIPKSYSISQSLPFGKKQDFPTKSETKGKVEKIKLRDTATILQLYCLSCKTYQAVESKIFT